METFLIIAIPAAIVMALLGRSGSKDNGPSAKELSNEIHYTGWEARRSMDQASDEYLRKVRQHTRR